MLGRLRKRQYALARTVLAVFIAGCLNLVIQPCLMATTLDACHESSTQSPATLSWQDDSAHLDTDCAHCPDSNAVAEDTDNASSYLCASMIACSDDVQQSTMNTAESQNNPWAAYSMSSWSDSAIPVAGRHRVQSAIGAPPPSLNIHYCRFLI